MKCSDVQTRLIESLYGELSPEAETRLREHLAGCDRCREELDNLKQTGRQLDALPGADRPLDMGRLYRTAANRSGRSRRRWRRLAWASSAAALLVAAFLATRLQFEWTPGRLVISSGSPPPAIRSADPKPADPPPVTPGRSAERLAVLEDLSRLLSVELLASDQRHAAAEADLRRRLDGSHRALRQLAGQMNARWHLAEQDIHDLYLTQFNPDSIHEGAIP